MPYSSISAWLRVGRASAIILISAFALTLFGCSPESASDLPRSYWVWKASDLQWVPEDSPLYLYQGDYGLYPGVVSFIKRGLSPSPALAARSPVLLVRVYRLEAPEELARQLAYLVDQWERRGAVISEVQLDHDSPSSQLEDYADYVRQLKQQLKKMGLYQAMSVTGLATWLADNPWGLERLARESHYIHFQLYNDYQPLQRLPEYLKRLQDYNHPYKLGITASPEFDKREFVPNGRYLGTTVFLNR